MTSMHISRNDLPAFGEFVTQLNHQEEKALRLLAIDGLLYKEIGTRIGLSSKSIERLVSSIVEKYRTFHYPLEQEAMSRRVLNRAACYYNAILPHNSIE